MNIMLNLAHIIFNKYVFPIYDIIISLTYNIVTQSMDF